MHTATRMHAHAHAHAHTHANTHERANTHALTHKRTQTRTCVCARACALACVRACARACARACVRACVCATVSNCELACACARFMCVSERARARGRLFSMLESLTRIRAGIARATTPSRRRGWRSACMQSRPSTARRRASAARSCDTRVSFLLYHYPPLRACVALSAAGSASPTGGVLSSAKGTTRGQTGAGPSQ